MYKTFIDIARLNEENHVEWRLEHILKKSPDDILFVRTIKKPHLFCREKKEIYEVFSRGRISSILMVWEEKGSPVGICPLEEIASDVKKRMEDKSGVIMYSRAENRSYMVYVK